MLGRRCFMSSVHRGMEYEIQVQRVLKSIGVDSLVTGGSSDGGIDLQGTWQLPDQQLRIVCQCKQEQKKCSVKYIREFETVLRHQPPGTLGIVAASAGFSLPSQRFFHNMHQAAILANIYEDKIWSFAINARARIQLQKLVTGSVYLDGSHQLCLLYDGKEL